jgi:hypothetical protein
MPPAALTGDTSPSAAAPSRDIADAHNRTDKTTPRNHKAAEAACNDIKFQRALPRHHAQLATTDSALFFTVLNPVAFCQGYIPPGAASQIIAGLCRPSSLRATSQCAVLTSLPSQNTRKKISKGGPHGRDPFSQFIRRR